MEPSSAQRLLLGAFVALCVAAVLGVEATRDTNVALFVTVLGSVVGFLGLLLPRKHSTLFGPSSQGLSIRPLKLLLKSAALFLIGCVVSLLVIVAITQLQPMGHNRIEALFAITVYVALFAGIPIALFSLLMTILAVTTRRSHQTQFAVTILTTLLIPLGIFWLLKTAGPTTTTTSDRAFSTMFAIKYVYIPAVCCCLTVVFTTRKLFRPSTASVQFTVQP